MKSVPLHHQNNPKFTRSASFLQHNRFDWLATLSSFRFIGQQGRFTAYRGGSRRCPKRTWSAYRYIHQRNYKHYLGVTDRLTIDCLEQGAATLQSHVAAL